MRLVTVIYEAGIDNTMMEAVTRMHLVGWTKLEGATGFGGKGLREGTAIWQGTNNLLFAAVQDAEES
jgi:PII-like signaling protein